VLYELSAGRKIHHFAEHTLQVEEHNQNGLRLRRKTSFITAAVAESRKLA
jgi:hypothetical protein